MNDLTDERPLLAEERRRYGRVELDLPCTVDGAAPGWVRSLSMGGASILARRGLGEVGHPLSIALELGGHGRLMLECRIYRVALTGGVRAEYGVELVHLDVATKEALEACLKRIMVGDGTGNRRAPRLSRRARLKCATNEEFYATMQDVTRGGVGILSSAWLAVGQVVTVELPLGSLLWPLSLAAVVLHAEAIPGDLYRAGLRFLPCTREEQARLNEIIQWLFANEAPWISTSLSATA